jgi:tetratricopeptide (TPR) repeat protein
MMWESERSVRPSTEADALSRLDREAILAEIRRLRREGRSGGAARLASALAERLTEDSAVQAEAGLCLAAVGDHQQAIMHFERALALDVRGATRLDCLIGAGNCLRVEGAWREALVHLATARREFPRDGAARAFYALALCDHGRSRRRAAGELLAILLDTTASGRIRLHEDELRLEVARLTEAVPHKRRPRPAEAMPASTNGALEAAAAADGMPPRSPQGPLPDGTLSRRPGA